MNSNLISFQKQNIKSPEIERKQSKTPAVFIFIFFF